MPKFDVHMTVDTSCILEVKQIIGEAFEDYKDNYGIEKLDEFIISAKEIG